MAKKPESCDNWAGNITAWAEMIMDRAAADAAQEACEVVLLALARGVPVQWCDVTGWRVKLYQIPPCVVQQLIVTGRAEIRGNKLVRPTSYTML